MELKMKKLPRPAYELWKLPRKEKKAYIKKYGRSTYAYLKKRWQEELRKRCSYSVDYNLDNNAIRLQTIFERINNFGKIHQDLLLYYFGEPEPTQAPK